MSTGGMNQHDLSPCRRGGKFSLFVVCPAIKVVFGRTGTCPTLFKSLMRKIESLVDAHILTILAKISLSLKLKI